MYIKHSIQWKFKFAYTKKKNIIAAQYSIKRQQVNHNINEPPNTSQNVAASSISQILIRFEISYTKRNIYWASLGNLVKHVSDVLVLTSNSCFSRVCVFFYIKYLMYMSYMSTLTGRHIKFHDASQISFFFCKSTKISHK